VTLVAFSTLATITLGSWIASGSGHSFHLWLLAVPAGSLTIGSLTVFLTYSKQLYQPMKNLSKLTLVASNAASSAERIQEIFNESREEEPPIFEDWEYWDYIHKGHTELRLAHRIREQPTNAAGGLEGIAYRGVVFGYEEGRPVLRGVDLDVPVGKRIALVGLSGSGKTTLVRLLPRFYEPWAGTITIGGVDIRDYPRDALRRSIGMVLQDSILFQGTIRENIVLDHHDATEREIVAAAKEACIHETIIKLPGGYDANVREHGKNFSSGQRQRIAIARAILRNAPIVILDEPTANLDVEAEAEVMRAIERLTYGRTVIVISHRLSTLGKVDQIAVLDAGEIVESGTYNELKASGGAFARLLAEQNRYAVEPLQLNGMTPAAGSGNGHHALHTLSTPSHTKAESGAVSRTRRRGGRATTNMASALRAKGTELTEDSGSATNLWWTCSETSCTYSVYSTLQTELEFWRTKHLQVVHDTWAEDTARVGVDA
jgi:ABC-type multidrug transport system fused ATPase/permease subunit